MHFQRLTCCTRQPEHPDDLRHCGKGNIPYGTWLPATVVLATRSLNQTASTSVYLAHIILSTLLVQHIANLFENQVSISPLGEPNDVKEGGRKECAGKKQVLKRK